MNFELKPYKGSRVKKKKIGRGGSRGKTSGRGHKGQGSRGGSHAYVGFEGGQMPIYRRLPKRGFKNGLSLQRKKSLGVVNLGDLNRYHDGDKIDMGVLRAGNLVKNNIKRVKLLGKGEFSKRLDVELDFISRGALNKLKEFGGSFKGKEVR